MADVLDIKKRATKQRSVPSSREALGDWRDNLLCDDKGKNLRCISNGITILSHDEEWKGVLAFDDFSQSIVTTRAPRWCADDAPVEVVAGDWSDGDTVRAQSWLHRRHSLRLGREAVFDAVRVVADRNVVHPVRDYLRGLRWDGVPRVDTWLTSYVGAASGDYTTLVGRCFLISAVARVMRPGCKVDTMIVFEGPQGGRKSSMLRTLFGEDYFSDTPFDLESKDRFMALRKAWCVELAELDSLRGADVNRIKSFLSSPSDSYRPPYSRSNVHVPRQTVVAGTTNATEYLRDDTGNRRFWPLRCGAIDLDTLARDRDQLWAEAREMFEGGATWWPDGSQVQICADEQGARLQTDAWQPLVQAYLLAKPPGAEVSVGDILESVAKLEPGRWTQVDQNRAAKCLRQAGWKRVQRRREGAREWVYIDGTSHQYVTSEVRDDR
jgi:putative DNA primase/helicase